MPHHFSQLDGEKVRMLPANQTLWIQRIQSLPSPDNWKQSSVGRFGLPSDYLDQNLDLLADALEKKTGFTVVILPAINIGRNSHGRGPVLRDALVDIGKMIRKNGFQRLLWIQSQSPEVGIMRSNWMAFEEAAKMLKAAPYRFQTPPLYLALASDLTAPTATNAGEDFQFQTRFGKFQEELEGWLKNPRPRKVLLFARPDFGAFALLNRLRHSTFLNVWILGLALLFMSAFWMAWWTGDLVERLSEPGP